MHFVPLLVVLGLLVLVVVYWQTTLIVAVIGAIVYFFVREQKRGKEHLSKIEVMEHQAKMENEARGGLPLRERPLDLVFFDQEYDRLYPETNRVDERYIEEIVIPALAGKPIERDEFQRHEFEQHRQKNVEQIKATRLHLRASVTFSLLDYDFEAKSFPVTIKFTIRRVHPDLALAPWPTNLLFPRWEQSEHQHCTGWLQARLPIGDVEAARRLRESGPSVKTALLILRPVAAHADYCPLELVSELLGVRLLAGDAEVPLLRGLRL